MFKTYARGILLILTLELLNGAVLILLLRFVLCKCCQSLISQIPSFIQLI